MVHWTFEQDVDPQDFSAVFCNPVLSGILGRFEEFCDEFLVCAGQRPLPLQQPWKTIDIDTADGSVALGFAMTLPPDRRLYRVDIDCACSVATLRSFIDALRYAERASGASELYYYDTVAHKTPLIMRSGATDREVRQQRLVMANSTVDFSRAPFHSTKSPHNVYGDAPRAVFDRVDFFLRHSDWYAVRGVPYQLGVLLSGEAGGGKTSTIKAVANAAARHIVSVDCKHLVASDQFHSLFFDDELHIAGGLPCRVPISDRLIVLEEVDQMPCFLKRSFGGWDEPLPNELSISDVLTTLDGAREAPGRMFILTSNHPEVIDPAILRPGRVDVHARFTLADEKLIRSMFAGLLDADPDQLDVPPEVVGRLSPASVAQVVLRKAYDAEVDVAAALRAAVAEECAQERERESIPEPPQEALPQDDQPVPIGCVVPLLVSGD